MSNTTAAALFANITKNTNITVTLTDGSDITGAFISINTKGVNVKTADGKTVSRGLGRVADVTAVVDTPADMFADGATYGAAAIAAALDMSAYDLRVMLRDMGYGVGKGRVYKFDAGDANLIYRAVKNG